MNRPGTAATGKHLRGSVRTIQMRCPCCSQVPEVCCRFEAITIHNQASYVGNLPHAGGFEVRLPIGA